MGNDAGFQRPTDAELAILRVLWEKGPSTVRAVHEAVAKAGGRTGYTTTLKLMQIMAEKGLATRDESERSHVYTAALPQEEVKGGLVSDLIERAFGGAARELVLHALSSRRMSPGDLKKIHEFLDEMEVR